MIKAGLISQLDAEYMERVLKHIITSAFHDDEVINTLEIGIFNGDTSRWIKHVVESNGKICNHTAIDSHADFKTMKPFEECAFVEGDSQTVYYKFSDEVFHFCFVDANHSYLSAVSDFFAYESKIKKGGYICFHDTSKNIKPFKDYQKIGDKENPDCSIAVRKALQKIGLLDNKYEGWKLIFDVADENDEAGGICIFKKARTT